MSSSELIASGEHRLPVIHLWNRILVPLQGDVTDDMAAVLIGDVLRALKDASAAGLVVDVTGMWTIDSHLCNVVATLARSAHLMGTPTILCGMSAAIAVTLQTMGVDLHHVRTALTLEDALERLGVSAVLRDLEVEDSQSTEPGAYDGHDDIALAQ